MEVHLIMNVIRPVLLKKNTKKQTYTHACTEEAMHGLEEPAGADFWK